MCAAQRATDTAVSRHEHHTGVSEQLLWVNLSYACYGLVIEDSVVAEAPPIARWMIGKHVIEVANWLYGKKAVIVEVEGVG